MKPYHLFVIILSLASGTWAIAQEMRCGLQPDIDTGNAAADAFFLKRVLKQSSVGKPAASRPSELADVATFGAVGDGRSDDTAALQRALNDARKVWLNPQHVYRITRRITMGSDSELASDGTATLLMAAGSGGFNNAVGRRTEPTLYGERGTALRIQGHDVAIRDFFIVKEFEDERYVIGIDVRASNRVKMQRLRLRGFSLAPGIITIRSSEQVIVASTLIYDACTASTHVPDDVASFQITGISVDDTRVDNRGSIGLTIENNVIADLRMFPLTYRRTQTDGINFAARGTGSGSVVRNNDVSNVDEALDIWGVGIDVSDNRLHATGTTVKLIHGARSIRVRGNEITAAGRTLALGLFRASPAEESRQVRDILVEGNRFHVADAGRYAIEVDREGAFAPLGVVVRNNVFEVAQCGQRVLACSENQCTASSNERRRIAGGINCMN